MSDDRDGSLAGPEYGPVTIHLIGCCARCGGDHRDILFTPFRRPPPDATWWAPCPETGEPILMFVIADPSVPHPEAIQ